MRIINSEVAVQVPATSANLGPGYDCLGMALSLYDRVKVRATVGQTKVHITGEGETDLPRDESHLIVRTIRATLDLLGLSQIGIEMWCHNRIPQSRGLGSSAAAIVAGMAVVRGLIDQPEELDEAMMLKIATAIEGHPDNLAPAIFGGITAAGWQAQSDLPENNQSKSSVSSPFLGIDPAVEAGSSQGDGAELSNRRETIDLLHAGDLVADPQFAELPLLSRLAGVWSVPIATGADLKATVFIPNFRLDTEQARDLIPPQIEHRDAVRNAANVALLISALQGQKDQLMAATQDWLHQEYRRPAMPASLDLLDWLRRREYPAVISGAGPTVLVLGTVPPSVQIQARNGGWKVRVLSVDSRGVQQV